MDELQARLYRPDIGGYSNDILPYYEVIAKWLPENAKIAEVGVYFGRSALFMAEQLVALNKKITFNCIDVWPKPHVLSEHKVNFMQMPSVDAANLIDDESLDFVFIDANHSYESVAEDIKAWFPKVRKGGIISGHDYNDKEYMSFDPFYQIDYTMEIHLGVVKAVDEFFPKDAIKLPTRTVWEITKD